MERRNRSLKALKELRVIDSFDSNEKGNALIRWNEKYLSDDSIEDFDLEIKDLEILKELFYKSINFLENHKEETRLHLIEMSKMKKFLKN